MCTSIYKCVYMSVSVWGRGGSDQINILSKESTIADGVMVGGTLSRDKG